jgi:hypothetical protein
LNFSTTFALFFIVIDPSSRTYRYLCSRKTCHQKQNTMNTSLLIANYRYINKFWRYLKILPSLMTKGLKQIESLCVVRHKNYFVTGLSFDQGQQTVKNQHFTWKKKRFI